MRLMINVTNGTAAIVNTAPEFKSTIALPFSCDFP